ncbi:MAG: hypothetical protein ACOX2N_00930 [Peptococcia bacterium]|jgi:hypothetical protein
MRLGGSWLSRRRARRRLRERRALRELERKTLNEREEMKVQFGDGLVRRKATQRLKELENKPLDAREELKIRLEEGIVNRKASRRLRDIHASEDKPSLDKIMKNVETQKEQNSAKKSRENAKTRDRVKIPEI